MSVIRKDKTYKLTKLPTLKETRFICNGQIGHTGSLIKRSVKGSVGIYKHTGLIYGYDHDDTLWIIENNVYGVECVSLRDFHLGMHFGIELNSNPHMIEIILKRAKERAEEKYHAIDNNCEHFTNYCLTGKFESNQINNTKNIVNVLISISELYLTPYMSDTSIVDNFTELRNNLRIERPEPIDKAIKEVIKKKKKLSPLVNSGKKTIKLRANKKTDK